MSVILDLEYGDLCRHFQYRKGLRVYPAGWGCCKAETESTLDGAALH